ncbi:MAG TPA: hypothetical protein VN673_03915 [Clostridia bacterium]|nr:hypothetical protein [Clostridia bacterium]
MNRTRHVVGAALRPLLAIYLMLHIVGTPIHLYLEPHSDSTGAYRMHTGIQVTSTIGYEADDSHSKHERHSASQHELQGLRTQRAPVADMENVRVAECLLLEKGRPEQQVLVSSGLSPPEIPRSWQFVFRAALPVRAPSFAS